MRHILMRIRPTLRVLLEVALRTRPVAPSRSMPDSVPSAQIPLRQTDRRHRPLRLQDRVLSRLCRHTPTPASTRAHQRLKDTPDTRLSTLTDLRRLDLHPDNRLRTIPTLHHPSRMLPLSPTPRRRRSLNVPVPPTRARAHPPRLSSTRTRPRVQTRVPARAADRQVLRIRHRPRSRRCRSCRTDFHSLGTRIRIQIITCTSRTRSRLSPWEQGLLPLPRAAHPPDRDLPLRVSRRFRMC